MFCCQCKKKSIVIIQCKCEQYFCVKHQLPEKHECDFTFQKHSIEKIPPTKKIEEI